MLKVILTEAKAVYNYKTGMFGNTTSTLVGYEPKEKFSPTIEFQHELDHLYNAQLPRVGDVFHGMGSFHKIVNCFVNFTRREIHVWYAHTDENPAIGVKL